MTHYRDPAGIVHQRSKNEKHVTAPYRETSCEDVARTTHWQGEQLIPTLDVPTCLWCVSR